MNQILMVSLHRLGTPFEGVKMRYWLGIVLFAAAPVSASPTYLSCQIANSEGAVTDTELTVDEEAQNVTVNIPSTGYSERRPALFSPTTVSFTGPDDKIVIGFEVSRTDLSIKRTLVAVGHLVGTDTGTCRVVQPPKRAF